MSSKSSVITSLIWKFLERIGTQGRQFVVVIVLAPLLAPADFGQIALGTVFIALANVSNQVVPRHPTLCTLAKNFKWI